MPLPVRRERTRQDVDGEIGFVMISAGLHCVFEWPKSLRWFFGQEWWEIMGAKIVSVLSLRSY
jgi:hypothetical protein